MTAKQNHNVTAPSGLVGKLYEKANIQPEIAEVPPGAPAAGVKITNRAYRRSQPHVNNGWDELEGFFKKSGEMLIQVASHINILIQAIGEHNLAGDKEIVIAINGFKNDLENFTEKLREIHALHEGRIGAVSADDLVYSIDISQQYCQFNIEFQALTSQPIMIISERIELAIQELHEKYKKEHPEEVAAAQAELEERKKQEKAAKEVKPTTPTKEKK